MSRFDREEYKPYVEELQQYRLVRRFAHGDMYIMSLWPVGSPRTWTEVLVWEDSEPADNGWRDPVETSEDIAWLPHLHDWVDLLTTLYKERRVGWGADDTLRAIANRLVWPRPLGTLERAALHLYREVREEPTLGNKPKPRNYYSVRYDDK